MRAQRSPGQGRREDCGGPAYIKVGPMGEGGLGACTPPGNFEILHALKCFLGLLRLFSSMHTVHKYLPVAVFV